jgi:hypothetical protein
MTQDEKLLLKDLCCRLPYGVILKCCNLVGEKLYTIDSNGLVNNDYDLEEVKPCLLPLSSMSLDQRIEYSRTLVIFDESHCSQTSETYDWLNKNHFDYRGLIEKGLAIDCTNLNIY